VIVLVPAYQPDRRLLELLRALVTHQVLVVDDGSGPDYDDIFGRAVDLGARVLRFPTNRGKGAALKAGFAHLLEVSPGHDVVCADSDGQHLPVDIERVAARLAEERGVVLGVRRFTGPVPLRSRIGNGITRIAFLATTGRALADTQTGLRGFPAHLLPWLLRVPGERYEYELQQLLLAVREEVPVVEVDITTVYLDDNSSSHFRPVVDSVRIYAPLVAFSASSLLAFAVDTVALFGLVAVTGSLLASAVLARLLSGSVNYAVNRRWVFRHRVPPAGRWSPAARYAALAALVLVLNVVLLEAVTVVVGSVVVAKAVTELTLFLASFVAQRHLVFGRRRVGPVLAGIAREEHAAATRAAS
jgi:putative flippase GtrA